MKKIALFAAIAAGSLAVAACGGEKPAEEAAATATEAAAVASDAAEVATDAASDAAAAATDAKM
jgi:hypothetical protein